jgi:hypothetical protein
LAKPIKETPFLAGKDAKIFAEKINRNKDRKASKEEYDKLMSVYLKMKDKLK